MIHLIHGKPNDFATKTSMLALSYCKFKFIGSMGVNTKYIIVHAGKTGLILGWGGGGAGRRPI